MGEEEPRPRIIVTPEELRTAFHVWMRVLPSHLWRRHEQYLKLKAERRSIPENMPDPRIALADYMADQFLRARWEASYPKPRIMVDTRRAPGSDPEQEPSR